MIKSLIFPIICILLGSSLVLEYFSIKLNLPWGLIIGLTAILFGLTRLISLTQEKNSDK